MRYIAQGYANKTFSDRLKMGPLKILTDGTLGARTAAMTSPYHDDPTTTGLLTYSDAELYALVKTAHQAGMSVAMHAIGDRAMTQVLDTYERVLEEFPRADHRHTIIHAQITTPAILERMRRLNVYAAVQPIFIDYDMTVVNERVGRQLAQTSYAWKTMQNLGINVAIGTDAPVEDINPFENIRAAVYRSNKAGHVYNLHEKMTVADAIHAYTKCSARQTRDEDQFGEIKVGHFADFAVLDRNTFVHLKKSRLSQESLDDLSRRETHLLICGKSIALDLPFFFLEEASYLDSRTASWYDSYGKQFTTDR
ncbi:MAG: amidohydrolase family protein [Bacillus subtilis]|nr:amidohydrolase family protein [Bacillus subtilis]